MLLYCSSVADPATFLALNGFVGGLNSSENSLFIQLIFWKYTYLWFYVMISWIL